jgi:hypothetical protein
MNEMNENKNETIAQILRNIQEQLGAAIRLIGGDASASAPTTTSIRTTPLPALQPGVFGTIVEGVFDGRGMVGPDGKAYPVPPNYASKSKLVEGDMMKLTITPSGAFIFKQIGPIERERKMGTLVHDQEVDEYSVLVGDKKYKVLKASITFFRGSTGDEAAVLIPKRSPSKWAAVENIVKRNFVSPL